MKANQEKFSVFIPIEFEKSVAEGEDRYANMKFKGIASNPNLGYDKQGQWLDPRGFDLNQFLREGGINWHHKWKDKPTAIIGEPTAASITKSNELYVEGRLYPSSQMARDVYDMAEIMEKDSQTRRMGFSIEGIPLKTDPRDKNRIIKAKITNLAITPSPVCPGTRMEIIKGGFDELQFEGEQEFVIDVVKDGVRYTVDRHLHIEKSEGGAPAYGGQAGSASSAESADRVTSKEHVEGGGDPSKKKKKKAVVKNNLKEFTKSELPIVFFRLFKNVDTDSVKNLCVLSEQIQKSFTPNMEVTKISKEAVDKALQTLGLPGFEKAEQQIETPETKEVVKAEDEAKVKLQAEYDETIKKAEEIKAKLEGKTEEKPVIEKSETPTIEPSVTPEIIKGFEDKIHSLATIVVSSKQENEELKKALDTQTLNINKLVEFNQKLSEKIGMIEKQPMERKSITGARAVERFEKAEGDQGGEGYKTYSLSNKTERGELAEIVYNAAVKEGKVVDKEFAKAVPTIELGSLGAIPLEANKLAARLMKEHKIIVRK